MSPTAPSSCSGPHGPAPRTIAVFGLSTRTTAGTPPSRVSAAYSAQSACACAPGGVSTRRRTRSRSFG
jgi:hypothetical protein